ncbi:MAG: DegV family protein [Chloroflexota bacterium]|nr:DegV family protein [Chloroflexota bacterium]
MSVKVVTDSTADLPGGLARELDVTVVPLSVTFGNLSFFDGVDFDADTFYQKLQRSVYLPTTSQPATGVFAQVYDGLTDETDEIVSIHISVKLSATINSALRGHGAMDKNCHIEIIDSQNASMGLGLIVIQAARAAQSGATLKEVIEVTQEAITRTHYFGMVDTLEYLHKGGRIGKAKALMGSLLNIKPLINVCEGEVHPVGKERTRKKAMARIQRIVEGFPNIKEMAIAHSTVPDDADAFADRVAFLFNKDRIYRSRIGPVIGTYLGPGSLAVGIME